MKNIFTILIIFIGFNLYAQQDAWVYFNAKPNAQSYFNNPLSMLTQRSLDRRVLQNIPLDIHDVPIYQPYIDQISAASGISVRAKSKWFNTLHIQGSLSDIQALTALSFVDHIDFADRTLNVGGRSPQQKRIKKVNKILESNVVFNYGNSLNQIEMLKGHLLHQDNFTGSGKIIAVMDGGFPGVNTASTFARLRTNNQILGGYDYVNRNSNFYTGISHGTSVLSLMGGYKDGQLVGTAPDANYYLFITEDGANEEPLELSNWVEAAEEADRLGVDIITTSLGYTEFDNTAYNFTYNDMNGTTTFISKGVNMAFSRGIVCVNSAGNSGNDPWFYISAPADALNAFTIGAVDASGNYASFSSQGPTFDGRIKPDVTAQGQNPYVSNTTGNVNNSGSGTSYSGPIIAGMVACLWQALPNKTNAELVQIIKESSSIYATPNNELGYGIPDFSMPLAGILNTNTSSKIEFKVYPNPAQNVISIAFLNGFENASITFYNTIGQKVLEKNITNDINSVSITNLNSGIYLYSIQSKNKFQTGKIIKQ